MWMTILGVASAFEPAAHTELPNDNFPSAAGDFDGDGDDELVTLSDGPNGLEVFAGSPAGLDPQPTGYPAHSEPTVLDANGDGYDDLAMVVSVLGAGGWPNWEMVLHLAGPTGHAARPAWTAAMPYIDPGWLTAGDVTGDGLDDLVMVGGSYGYWVAQIWEGSTGRRPLRWLQGFRPNEVNGEVAVSDLNGDGFGDLVNVDRSNQQLLVFRGSARGVTGGPTHVLPHAGIEYPSKLVGGMDLDGDGAEDVAVSTSAHFAILWGNTAGRPRLRDVPAPAPVAGLGCSIAAVPDVDSDGADELVVGYPFYRDPAYPGSGAVAVYLGAITPPAAAGPFVTLGGTNLDAGGIVLGGDFDGDGRGDWAFSSREQLGVNYAP